MNRFDRSKQHQSFNRSNEITVSKAFVVKMEGLCLSAFLSGNMEAYVLGMNSLAKLQKQDAISNDLAGLNAQMTALTKAVTDTE